MFWWKDISMSNKSELIKKIAISGVLLGVIIAFQFIKNIDAVVPVSGAIINTAMALEIINVGLWPGVGFATVVPALSLLIAPSSGTSILANATYGVSVLIIAMANVIFLLFAKYANFLYKKYNDSTTKIVLSIFCLIVGALLKWLFMWAMAEWLIANVFNLNTKQLSILTKVFSINQLIAASCSIPLIFAVQMALNKVYYKNN